MRQGRRLIEIIWARRIYYNDPIIQSLFGSAQMSFNVQGWRRFASPDRACEARPGLAKCGGRKPHKGGL